VRPVGIDLRTNARGALTTLHEVRPGVMRVALARATAISPAKRAILAIEFEALRVAAARDDLTLENAWVDEQAPLSMLP